MHGKLYSGTSGQAVLVCTINPLMSWATSRARTCKAKQSTADFDTTEHATAEFRRDKADFVEHREAVLGL